MKKRVNEAESHSKAIPDGRGCREGSSQSPGKVKTRRKPKPGESQGRKTAST